MSDPPEETYRAGRVALVGRANVGKSTLLNALLGQAIAITSHHPQTTRDPVRGVLTVDATQYIFVDTPGLHAPRTRLGHHMNQAALQAARDADALLLLVETPRPSDAAKSHADLVALVAELPKLPTILAINKIDRLKEKKALLPLLATFAAAGPFVATVPMSGRRADGLDRLLAEIRPLLPEQPHLFDGDTLSDQPTRFFVAEFVREQILRQTRQEVPHGVAVVVEGFDETSTPVRIDAAVIVAREAHKKIVIGAQGKMLKSVGMAARARVEEMLSRKVSLYLWVRATPGWMDDPLALRELGFAERDDG